MAGDKPAIHLFSEPGHDQEGVIDSNSEAHHRDDREHEDRHGVEGGQEVHGRQGAGDCKNPHHNWQDRSEQCAECEDQDGGRRDQGADLGLLGVCGGDRAHIVIECRPAGDVDLELVCQGNEGCGPMDGLPERRSELGRAVGIRQAVHGDDEGRAAIQTDQTRIGGRQKRIAAIDVVL